MFTSLNCGEEANGAAMQVKVMGCCTPQAPNLPERKRSELQVKFVSLNWQVVQISCMNSFVDTGETQALLAAAHLATETYLKQMGWIALSRCPFTSTDDKGPRLNLERTSNF